MGFEPFIPPKRVVPTPDKLPQSASREDRVLALAKLLHSRGITSSLADAKRLAEGMVDVEKKVIKQTPKVETKPPVEITETKSMKQSFGLNLPENFSKFVAEAATLNHDEVKPSVSIPEQKPITYGRETQQTVAAVPHVYPQNQMFFDHAPDLTKARGYKGPKLQPVEFETQKEKPIIPKAEPAQVTRVATGDAGISVTKVETQPNVEVVQEKVIVVEKPTEIEKPEALKSDLEDENLPEKTVELPKSEKPREQVDLAKQHGVDLFEMFKKKA